MEYKRISATSKKAKAWKGAYNYFKDMITLNDAYTKPSTAKQNAYNSCVREMQKQGGWGKRIIGHNSMMFTFAYMCEREEDGFLLRVITRYNNYEFVWNPF